MKSPASFLAFIILALLPLAAQQGDGYGFLNITNLIPGETPCEISIGGEEVVKGGLGSGAHTGWFMVGNGSKTLTISMAGLDPASGSIEITEGAGNLVGIFLEPDKRRKPDGKPYPPKLRIKSFPTYESKGFGLKFVSLCPGDNRFKLGPLNLDPKRFAPVEIPKWNGSGFEVFCNGDSIGNAGGSSESGAFYLLVGTDSKGGYVSALVNSDRQEVPEYLKKNKTKPEPESSGPLTENPTTQP